MRTTIDLPPDLHRILSSLALHTGRSLSATAAELMRLGLNQPAPSAPSKLSIDRKTGLPTVHLGRSVTPEDVKALDDDV